MFYDQARKLVGDEKYFRALRTYCDEQRWAVARPDTFTKLLGKLSPPHARPLEKLRKRWWDEAHGDEDLGKPDLGGLFGGLSDTPGQEQLDPQTLRLLQDALKALQGE